MSHTIPHQSFHPERGGVGFYIILAIAMLAGLTYMMTRENRFGTKAFGTDQSRMAAQEIISYGSEMATVVHKMRLRNCTESQLNFANSAWTNNDTSIVHPTGHNPSAPASGCNVFDIDEGKITPVVFSSKFFIPEISPTVSRPGSARIRIMSVPGIGNNANDELVYWLPHVTQEVCIAINNLLEVGNPGGIPPEITVTPSDYTGSYGSNAVVPVTGSINNKNAFCVNVAGDNRFVQVLIAR